MPRLSPVFSLLLGAAFTHASLLASGPSPNAISSKLTRLFTDGDLDHDQTLSREEQRAILNVVEKKYGDGWSREVARLIAQSAGPDGSILQASWIRTIESLKASPEKTTERVRMRDGIHLATDVYLPAGQGPFPVVLSRTPYSRVHHSKGVVGFSRDHFAVVIQDMRGRFDSEGENLPFIGCGWGEHQDGVDTIEWMRKQPWCDGNIVTIGGSAGGITQNLLAGAAPVGLCAQYVSVAFTSMYSDISYTGNALRKMDVEGWLQSNHFDPRALALTLSHPSYGVHWKDHDTSTRFSKMAVPAVHVGGWFDMFAQGTIDQFIGRQHLGDKGSRGTQKLIMGPWTHAVGGMPAGDLEFPNASQIPPQYNAARWFAHYAKREPNGIDQEPAVAYYVMGDTSAPGAPGNEWRFAEDWPIPSKETPFHFTADHTLQRRAPGTIQRSLEYTFDPVNPCPTLGGNNLAGNRGPRDQRKVEDRSDALLFTSDPLDEPMEITGRIIAKLFVSTSTPDSDLSVRVCDVYPDGRSLLMAEGMQRLRYRKSPETPEPMTPGTVEEVTVDCWSTSLIFNKGHRIRVMVTSSNYPRFDLNPGTGEPWGEGVPSLKQTNRIHCDQEHPSRLLLPRVENTR